MVDTHHLLLSLLFSGGVSMEVGVKLFGQPAIGTLQVSRRCLRAHAQYMTGFLRCHRLSSPARPLSVLFVLSLLLFTLLPGAFLVASAILFLSTSLIRLVLPGSRFFVPAETFGFSFGFRLPLFRLTPMTFSFHILLIKASGCVLTILCSFSFSFGFILTTPRLFVAAKSLGSLASFSLLPGFFCPLLLLSVRGFQLLLHFDPTQQFLL